MKYLNYDHAWLTKHGAIHTAREISQQPRLWRELLISLEQSQPLWKNWLSDLLATPDLRIILTGAGSSAFAGRALMPWLRETTGLQIDAISTTDIVAHPNAYFSTNSSTKNSSNNPTLLVSFARSGNSPESVAAVALADQLIPNCHHLVLTCNPNGGLARYCDYNQHARCIVMPEGSNDQSFAMTSSFTCMFTAAAMMLAQLPLAATQKQLAAVASLCEEKLSTWPAIAHALTAAGCQRVLYLGSGGLSGLADEAALKMLELTAGQIVTASNSPLGVRHGPKFMIDASTCVVLFLSSQDYTRRYDDDLHAEIVSNGIARHVVVLGSNLDSKNEHGLEVEIADLSEKNDFWLTLPYLLFVQLFAFESSLALGLHPDNPCPTGEVNRVVQGVTIYPFSAAE